MVHIKKNKILKGEVSTEKETERQCSGHTARRRPRRAKGRGLRRHHCGRDRQKQQASSPVTLSTVWESLRRVPLSAAPRPAARQALPMGFSRQEDCSGLPRPPPGSFPTRGLNARLLQLLHLRQTLYPLNHRGDRCILTCRVCVIYAYMCIVSGVDIITLYG